MRRRFAWVLALVTVLLGSQPAAAEDAAGEITLITGLATAVSLAGAMRELRRHDPIWPGDLIDAGPRCYLNIRFVDQSLLLLRPNSRLRVERYRSPRAQLRSTPAAAAPGEARFRLLKGGLRAVSGAIAHMNRDRYRLITDVADIGVRGTDYFALRCGIDCAADARVRAALPAGSEAARALLAGVLQGAIVVQPRGGRAGVIDAGNRALIVAGRAPILLSGSPEFLDANPFPDPRSCLR